MRLDDHALLEALVRKLLDDLRDTHFRIARDADASQLERLLDDCRETHARLCTALPLSADRARALGFILVDVLSESIDALRAMVQDGADGGCSDRVHDRGGDAKQDCDVTAPRAEFESVPPLARSRLS